MEAPNQPPATAAAPAEGIMSSVTNAIGNTVGSVATVANQPITTPTVFAAAPPGVQDTATAGTAASIDNVKNAFANMTSVNEHMFYLIVIVFLVMVIVGYLLYNIITDNILFQQKIEVSGTEVPVLGNQLSEFKIDKVLANSNGIKRTYGFWIYINDINKYNGSFRHIAHLGKEAKEIKNACPYIFLDKYKNEIHVRFAPKAETLLATQTLNAMQDSSSLLNYTDTSAGGAGVSKKCGITIKYVPIQRWVYIVIVVSDVNGGLVYTYIDGELAEVDMKKLVLHELDFETRPGGLFVGGSLANSLINATGFSGLISKFTVYNYDLNKNDIYKEYNKGPLNGLLTSMGIVSYGLRNPVYKLNNVY
jgi:hypothetical protein